MRTLKEHQRAQQQKYQQMLDKGICSSCSKTFYCIMSSSKILFIDITTILISIAGVQTSSKGKSRKQKEEECNHECWVGHPLDPIGCLFDTLTDASIVRDETTNTSQGMKFECI